MEKTPKKDRTFPRAVLTRLIKTSGVKRVSIEASDKLGDILVELSNQLLGISTQLMKTEKKQTMKERHIVGAYQIFRESLQSTPILLKDKFRL